MYGMPTYPAYKLAYPNMFKFDRYKHPVFSTRIHEYNSFNAEEVYAVNCLLFLGVKLCNINVYVPTP